MKVSKDSMRACSTQVYVRAKRRKVKRATRLPKAPRATSAHDSYDNSIGGPNDYAYGM